ncbi:LPS export ABC transporter periplasmic protein LptC [Ferruginibacter lapsinanis]|uniref:LPS export ABC transporter periplasmic protein LptC n=1 Tax=Ferruginibacter lapsinanis TaxID=563172 RepID=UPI001E398592|nr:LPS export ABC transporter periplasmic protein LptC [Ferruginibacter lapsinanis]UEG50927.1 LPS export ABC transporter periplasmic protein LptC [Ferruginibacter lapsinanis]
MTSPSSLYKILFITALATSCIFFYSCNNDKLKKKNIGDQKTGVEVAKDVRINYSIAGNRKAVLVGPLMYRVQDTVSYIEFPKTIHVDFFNAADVIESKLDARYAKYKDNQNIVFLKDSVRIVNVKGDTLYCDELYWDRTRTNTEFYTEKPVRIRTRTHLINGIGMDASQDFTEWHIVQSTGFVKVPSSQFPN